MLSQTRVNNCNLIFLKIPTLYDVVRFVQLMLCYAGGQYFFQINCTVEKCSVGTNDTVPDVSGIILSLSITRRTIFQARKMNNSLCIISQYSYEGKVNDPKLCTTGPTKNKLHFDCMYRVTKSQCT